MPGSSEYRCSALTAIKTLGPKASLSLLILYSFPFQNQCLHLMSSSFHLPKCLHQQFPFFFIVGLFSWITPVSVQTLFLSSFKSTMSFILHFLPHSGSVFYQTLRKYFRQLSISAPKLLSLLLIITSVPKTNDQMLGLPTFICQQHLVRPVVHSCPICNPPLAPRLVCFLCLL